MESKIRKDPDVLLAQGVFTCSEMICEGSGIKTFCLPANISEQKKKTSDGIDIVMDPYGTHVFSDREKVGDAEKW